MKFSRLPLMLVGIDYFDALQVFSHPETGIVVTGYAKDHGCHDSLTEILCSYP